LDHFLHPLQNITFTLTSGTLELYLACNYFASTEKTLVALMHDCCQGTNNTVIFSSWRHYVGSGWSFRFFTLSKIEKETSFYKNCINNFIRASDRFYTIV